MNTTRSFSKYLSKRVIKKLFYDYLSTKNGKGIDGLTTEKFIVGLDDHIEVIIRKSKHGNYKFSRYLELLKSKGRDSKPRVISLATVRDKLVLLLIKEFLHSVFNDSVNRKLPNNYIREVKSIIGKPGSKDLYLYKADITKFYDSINHGILLMRLRKRIKSKRVLMLIDRSMKNLTVPLNYKRENYRLMINEKGVPQGLSISNILANIYMAGLDKRFNAKKRVKYLRYVDDILLLGKKPNVDKAIQELKLRLKALDLEVNKTKEDYKSGVEGLEYLGYFLNDHMVTVRKSTVERFIKSISAMFSHFKNSKHKRIERHPWLNEKLLKAIFVAEINEKITGAISEKKRYGWIFYFMEINDLGLLYKLDSIVNEFFKRLPEFNYQSPRGVKRFIRAHFEAKFNSEGGYIHNYNKYKEIDQKIEYLRIMGYLHPKKQYSVPEIEKLFLKVRKRHLDQLEVDVATMS